MTISRVNPSASSQIVVETVSTRVTFSNSMATEWVLESYKSGYTPVSATPLSYGWCTEIKCEPEDVTMEAGHFKLRGFGRITYGGATSRTPTVSTRVCWVKS